MKGLRRILRLRHRADEIHEEIQSHLEMRAELNAQSGMPPAEARTTARRQFGNAALIEEDTRRVHAGIWLETLGQDVRYALRGFARAPVFTLAATLTIALGVGASTAVFSVVDRVLFRPLPYPDAERLVSVGLIAPRADTNEFLLAPAFLRLAGRQTPFSSVAAFGFVSPCDLTETNPVRLRAARVDASFLPTFGIQPIAGRNFTPQEDVPNSPPVALLSFGFWTSRFASDPSVVGRAIPIDGQPTTILGVLPREFELFNLSRVDLLMPAALAARQNGRAIRAFARLKPGVRIEQARRALEPWAEEERQQVPAEFRPGLSLAVRPLRDRQIGDAGAASWMLLGSVILVLLMACANVANLMLSRSAARRSEVAVRAALGASRVRLLRQALTESLLLAGLGAVAGCVVAAGLLRFFVALSPNALIRLNQAAIDRRVLLFAIGASLFAGVLFGVCGTSLTGDLAPDRPGAPSRTGLLRHALIAVQIAASLVLLTGAGLLMRSLWLMERVAPGINPEHAVVAEVVLPKTASPARLLSFFEGMETRMAAQPGVAAVTVANNIPLGGARETAFSALQVEGRPRLAEGTGGGVAWRYITPGYFAAMGIPILRGRTFTEADRAADGAAIMLTESLAHRLFPDEDAIGKRIFIAPDGPWRTVAGIVGDIHDFRLQSPEGGEYYLVRKHAADPVFGDGSGWRGAAVVVRSPLEPRAVAGMIRSTAAQIEPALPVAVETLRQRLRVLTEQPRFNAWLLGGFAGCGLLVAAIGIYGVVAFLVSRRAREVGVRMALGARPASITRLFVAQSARWTSLGVVTGLAGSLATTRLLTRLLYRVAPRDPWSFVSAALILSATAVAAAWLPSRRAARIDPVRTLREE